MVNTISAKQKIITQNLVWL